MPPSHGHALPREQGFSPRRPFSLHFWHGAWHRIRPPRPRPMRRGRAAPASAPRCATSRFGAVRHQLSSIEARQLVPVLLDVEVGADPAVAADVRRDEVPVGRRGDERLLETRLALHPQRPALAARGASGALRRACRAPSRRAGRRTRRPRRPPAARGQMLRSRSSAASPASVRARHRRTTISSSACFSRSGTTASSAG